MMERLAKSLVRDGFSAAMIHGDRSQAQRTGALSGFEQYIRSCAAGDDHGADVGLDRYEQAAQDVYRIVDRLP